MQEQKCLYFIYINDWIRIIVYAFFIDLQCQSINSDNFENYRFNFVANRRNIKQFFLNSFLMIKTFCLQIIDISALSN